MGDACTADSVYRACYEQVMCRIDKYYKRYPEDIKIVQEPVTYLAEKGGLGDASIWGHINAQRTPDSGSFWLGIWSWANLCKVWDPILVPEAPKRISYNFLSSFFIYAL
ncbi:uncharacterized protein LOC114743706 [Neltuma alba]|uniref:uncharacterized protein LOC114743706 n=1 Tax=Neltuma alba TaxID=207710 RepID=UPI0010A2CBBB|nr:uncharacterized protein LOC114743706 [Prosopis alba]